MNWDFNKSLRARGLNQTSLAAAINCSRSHLCQVLNNRDGRGGQTRRKLWAYLTVEEIVSLGWQEEFDEWRAGRAFTAALLNGRLPAFPALPPHVPIVPHGTKLQEVEQ